MVVAPASCMVAGRSLCTRSSGRRGSAIRLPCLSFTVRVLAPMLPMVHVKDMAMLLQRA